MVETLLTAVLTCISALFIGQAALRLSGAKEWSWLAPPIGIAITMAIAMPVIHVPGQGVTVAAILVLLTIGSIAYCVRVPAQLPPLGGVLAAAPAAALALVPIVAAGHSGILGTSLFNDMAVHLKIVESFNSEVARSVYPLPRDYPLGPHAVVAVISKATGFGPEYTFTGWTVALPVISAWTALSLARRAPWLGQVVVATVVGMPFLVAAYFGQGGYKEILQANLVLATVLLLAGYGPRLRLGRWVPLSLLVVGIVSVYSVAGLPWPVLFCAAWLAGTAFLIARREGLRSLPGHAKRSLPAIGVGLGVLVVALIPQVPRLVEFISIRNDVNGTGIEVTDLGNLVGPLPVWEAFGVWTNPDFRMPADPGIGSGLWVAFVVILVLIGAFWAFRRGRWMLPVAAAGSILVWALSSQSQSPYVTAKALAIASPLLLALAVFPLAERCFERLRWWPVAALLALVLFGRVLLSDVEALRISPVGPTAHAHELKPLRSLLAGQPTLFLGNDDFIEWELAGTPVSTVLLTSGTAQPTRPEKPWAYGQPADFDLVGADVLNQFDWIVTTRDAASSAPPPQLRLVRSTPSYQVWKRTGEIRERSVLPEGEFPGKILDCGSAEGRDIVRRGGVAGIRPQPVVVPGAPVFPGSTTALSLPLPPGRWDLSASFTSTFPVEATFGDRQATLPPNLDRLGPRWPIGRLDVRDAAPTELTLHIEDTPLTPGVAAAIFGNVVATRVAAERVVPIAEACGAYVDWYRSGP